MSTLLKQTQLRRHVIFYAPSSASENIECQMRYPGKTNSWRPRATSSSCSRTQRIVRLRLTFWHLTFSILFLRTTQFPPHTLVITRGKSTSLFYNAPPHLSDEKTKITPTIEIPTHPSSLKIYQKIFFKNL